MALQPRKCHENENFTNFAIALLNDDKGISTEAWSILKDVLVSNQEDDICTDVVVDEGRCYINFDKFFVISFAGANQPNKAAKIKVATLRKLAIALLNDEGISTEAWNILSDVLLSKKQHDIIEAAQAFKGRWWLSDDAAASMLKVEEE